MTIEKPCTIEGAGEHKEKRDYFQEHPPEQPKADIGAYVESCGVLVAPRYAGYKDALRALAKGERICVRSEHKDEYDGMSGLLKTYKFSLEDVRLGLEALRTHEGEISADAYLKRGASENDRWNTEQMLIASASIGQVDQDFFEAVLADLDTRDIQYYAKLSGQSLEKVASGISYSYWKEVPGFNRSIIEDTAIRGKYYITAVGYREGTDRILSNVTIVEKDRIVSQYGKTLTDELQASLPKLIEQYETVRQLSRFDSDHCPMIEIQTAYDGQHYFLQYHRTRDRETAQFTLTRKKQEDEIEAIMVRGVTPPGGITVEVGGYYVDRDDTLEALLQREAGSFDWHFNQIFISLASKHRQVNCMLTTPQRLAGDLVTGHAEKERVFSAKLFVALPPESLSKEYVGEHIHQAVVTRKRSTLTLHIESDGRRALVKILKK